VVIETSRGAITVELFPEQAPLTVANFLQYVDDGHYADTIFHRVIAGMIIQGGGLTPEGEEKPTRKPIRLESDNGLLNVRGSIAMARSAEKDSAMAQFYINVGDNPEFDRGAQRFGYTVFGRVTEGMAVVDRISKVQTSRRANFDDIPILPVFIDKVRRAAAPAQAAP
jgi:cyclophilin family peptidyl-prolyl cis-trans isomerase